MGNKIIFHELYELNNEKKQIKGKFVMRKRTCFNRLFDRLREAYSESEIINMLSKKLSEREIELGKTLSENDELFYKISITEKEIKRLRNIEEQFNQVRLSSKKNADENRQLKLQLKEKENEIRELLNRLHDNK